MQKTLLKNINPVKSYGVSKYVSLILHHPLYDFSIKFMNLVVQLLKFDDDFNNLRQYL